jgi:hypothetical protein
MDLTPYHLILAIPILAAIAGSVRHGAPRPDAFAALGAGIVGIGAGVLAATLHDPGVPLGAAIGGVAAAAALLGALPPYLFFVIGRALAGHPITLGVVCLASIAPLAYYYLIGLILVFGAVGCPPDAYECPV